MNHDPLIGRIIMGACSIKLPDGRVGVATEDPFRGTDECTGVIMWFRSEAHYLIGLMPGSRLIDSSYEQEVRKDRTDAVRYLKALAKRPLEGPQTVKERMQPVRLNKLPAKSKRRMHVRC